MPTNVVFVNEKRHDAEADMNERSPISGTGTNLRKANDCFTKWKRSEPPRHLFDEFWREGEVALLFGEPGTGKSILAMQIADALARGRPIGGFRMPAGRRNVLYVDLVMEDAQFRARYTSGEAGRAGKRRYRFAESLYRGAPPADADLVAWIREVVSANNIRIVVIDDLSAIKRTHDGTLETLWLMRGLRRLRSELNISVLVLSDAAGPGQRRYVSEADLGRSRILCRAADSVFCLGRHRKRESGSEYFLIQTSSRSPIFWTDETAPYATIVRGDDGMLRLHFDERFADGMDPERRRMICRVKRMRDEGRTYRWIGDELGFSHTWARRLGKKWTPALGELEEVERDKFENEADDGPEEDRYGFFDDPGDPDGRGVDGPEQRPVYQPPPPIYGPNRVAIRDLDRAWDALGKEIFIERRGPRGPSVWYMFDRSGNAMRKRRTLFGIRHENLGRMRVI